MRRKRKEILIDKLHKAAVTVTGGIGAGALLLGISGFDSNPAKAGMIMVPGMIVLALVAIYSNFIYWGDENDDVYR